LLGETLDWPVVVVAAGVTGCVAAARRFAR
jgi:hypothetical protein